MSPLIIYLRLFIYNDDCNIISIVNIVGNIINPIVFNIKISYKKKLYLRMFNSFYTAIIKTYKEPCIRFSLFPPLIWV